MSGGGGRAKRASSSGTAPSLAGMIRPVADLLADVRRVRQVADVFGPTSTALSMRKIAERRSNTTTKTSADSRISYSLSRNAPALRQRR